MDLRYRITCVTPATSAQECRKLTKLCRQRCSFLGGELPHHGVPVKVSTGELHGHAGLPGTTKPAKLYGPQLAAAIWG